MNLIFLIFIIQYGLLLFFSNDITLWYFKPLYFGFIPFIILGLSIFKAEYLNSVYVFSVCGAFCFFGWVKVIQDWVHTKNSSADASRKN